MSGETTLDNTSLFFDRSYASKTFFRRSLKSLFYLFTLHRFDLWQIVGKRGQKKRRLYAHSAEK